MIGFLVFVVLLVQSAALHSSLHWAKPLLRLQAVSGDTNQLSHAEVVRQIRSTLISQKEGAGSDSNGPLVSMLSAFVEEYARYAVYILGFLGKSVPIFTICVGL